MVRLVLLKGCDVLGVFWGEAIVREPDAHRDNMAQLLAWIGEGRIRPHIHGVFPLAETVSALRQLADRKVQGKVIIRP